MHSNGNSSSIQLDGMSFNAIIRFGWIHSQFRTKSTTYDPLQFRLMCARMRCAARLCIAASQPGRRPTKQCALRMTCERETSNAIDSVPLTYGNGWKERENSILVWSRMGGGEDGISYACIWYCINAMCAGVCMMVLAGDKSACALLFKMHVSIKFSMIARALEHWTSNSQRKC